VDKVVDMRRRLVEEGSVPGTLQKAMADLEKRGNPYGKMARKRGDWMKDGEGTTAGVRLLAEGDRSDMVWFTDSAAAFDPRIAETARSFAAVLAASGHEAGTLGKAEVDSGHEARRLGEEGLFQALRDQNLEALEARTFEKVITTDPHAFNGLRNDYPLDKPVLHHSQVLAELLQTGRIRLNEAFAGRTLTFHDPCYLGRHNGVFEAPRRVLDALPGVRTVEMERCRNRSFCCGGGSLYLFMEGESERRMGEVRLEMAADAGAEVVVTACPYCLINLEDAIKTTGREGELEALDLAEVVEKCLVRSE
jgi:Fe-S oxidoreductase